MVSSIPINSNRAILAHMVLNLSHDVTIFLTRRQLNQFTSAILFLLVFWTPETATVEGPNKPYDHAIPFSVLTGQQEWSVGDVAFGQSPCHLLPTFSALTQ